VVGIEQQEVWLILNCVIQITSPPRPIDYFSIGIYERLQGFWLAECIANWSGLITEMDKVSRPFYTDENWVALMSATSGQLRSSENH